MYVLDRSSMKAVQQFPASTNQYDPTQRDQLWDSGPHLHGSPTYWQGPDRRFGFLYVWGEKDFLRMYRFDKVAQKFEEKSKPPLLSSFSEVRLFHQGPVRALRRPMPGGMLSISANGTRAGTGIVWATLPAFDLNPEFKPFPGRLYAFDAESLKPLWDTGWNYEGGVLGHWVPPTIADGNVFLAAGDWVGEPRLIVYELGPETGHGRQSWAPFQPRSIFQFLGDTKTSPAVESCKACHKQEEKLQDLLRPKLFHDHYPSEASVRMLPVVALQQVAPPQGHRKSLLLEGNGLRGYDARENPAARGKLIWRLKESTADLVEFAAPSAGKESPVPMKIRLSPGWVWSASDGSTVVSAIEKTVPAPESTHGEWLLFKVVKSSGHGILSDQSYIQCVYTHGGHAPAAPPKGRGEIAKVPYYAQYLFYQ